MIIDFCKRCDILKSRKTLKVGSVMDSKRELTDEEVVARVQTAVKLAIEKQKAMGIDIVRYDPKANCLYTIDASGKRTVVQENVKRVRYSEQTSPKPKT